MEADRVCAFCGGPYPDGDESGTLAGRLMCGACSREHDQKLARERYGEIADRYPRMRRWSFDTYPDDKQATGAREQIQTWLDDLDEQWLNVYLHGPVGTGKTGLTWCAMRSYIDRYSYERVDFVNVRDLLAAVRRSFSDSGAADPLEGLAEPQLLVLDDLGAERPTEWGLDVIGTLVEERYQRECQTVVTSNYSPAELVKRLKPTGSRDGVIGQRIVSRLVESCMVIRLDGIDRRLGVGLRSVS